jgi:co-chaperonin GroES (HSP10)
MKKNDIHPRNSQVLFEVVKVERVTPGGLVLPGNEDQEAPLVGRVLEVGIAADCSDITVGKKILLPRGVSTRIPLSQTGDEVVLLTDQRYIIANID